MSSGHDLAEVENGGNEGKEDGGIKYNRETGGWWMSQLNGTSHQTGTTYALTRLMAKKKVKTPKLNSPTEKIGTSVNKSSS